MFHKRDHRPEDSDSRRGPSNDPARAPASAPSPAIPYTRPEGPPIPPGVPAVHLKSIRMGAFIYERMVDRVEGDPSDGDIVAVADKYGRLFGWAFWHSRSQIALRMISRGGPMPDDALFAARVRRAVALRHDVLQLPRTTDAYRLIHAEGDGLSGLVADRFGPYVVIELFSLAMFQRIEKIEDALIDAGLSVRQIIVRADKRVLQQEGFNLGKRAARRDLPVEITENGVKFLVQAGGGHKTGFFCDQRDNRLALAEFTEGKSVLDVCCYTGGFAIYAATRGRAAEVTGVDLDEEAIAAAKVNARLNAGVPWFDASSRQPRIDQERGDDRGCGEDAANHGTPTMGSAPAKIDFQHADAFDFLRSAGQQGRKWDVVIADPSKFVAGRAMMDVGLRKYFDLNRLAAGVVAPGGILLTCCCSGLVDEATFLDTVGRAVRAGPQATARPIEPAPAAAKPIEAGRQAQVFRVTGPGGDHPVLAAAPEGDYLKAVWARVL